MTNRQEVTPMKTLPLQTLGLGAIALSLLLITPAEAGQRSGSRSWSGPHGGTVAKSWARGGGEASRSVVRSGPQGATLTRSWDRSVDREAGALSRSQSTTFPSGQTASRERDLTRNPDGTVTAAGSATNRAGETREWTRTWAPVD
jgi:hypothetical protein